MTKKRNGRPPLDPNDPATVISFRLPGRQYHKLRAQAQREGLTIGDLIRRDLAQDVRRGDGEEDKG